MLSPIQVVTIGPRFLFVHAQYRNSFLLDKYTGKIITTLTQDYAERMSLLVGVIVNSSICLFQFLNEIIGGSGGIIDFGDFY